MLKLLKKEKTVIITDSADRRVKRLYLKAYVYYGNGQIFKIFRLYF